MARIFTEGFESGDINFFTVPAGQSYTATVRPGGSVYSLGTGTNGNNVKIFPVSYSEVYIRFAVYGIGSYSFSWRKNGTVLGGFNINTTTRHFQLYTGNFATLVATGTKIIINGTWYLVELHIKIADAGGTIELKTEGYPDASFIGDTKPGADADFNEIVFFGDANWAFYDDIAMNDTTGLVDNSWCGDGHIIAIVPNGTGTFTQLTNQLGNSTNNYLYVDDVPSNNDTDYVEGTVTDRRDYYNLTNPTSASGTILRIWPEARARDTVAATGTYIALPILTNGIEFSGTTLPLVTTYKPVYGDVYLINPATTGTWTFNDLNNLQAGIAIR